MSPREAGDMRMIALKLASGDITSAAVTIPVSGGAGVDLGCVGRTLGLEPSTVRLNGHFISRGADLVSSLLWNSLVSFFVARGLPAGGSLMDSIVVQGKLIANTGFKRKATIEDEKAHKKSRLLECCSMEQNIDTEQLADKKCLCIKRHLKLVADQPSKKGKIDECSSGFSNEGAKITMVSTETVFNCSFVNLFGKRSREDDTSPSLFCKRIK